MVLLADLLAGKDVHAKVVGEDASCRPEVEVGQLIVLPPHQQSQMVGVELVSLVDLCAADLTVLTEHLQHVSHCAVRLGKSSVFS